MWNRHLQAAETLAAALRALGSQGCSAPDLQAAVQPADIVNRATLATQALVQGARLQPGAHLDLIGSFTPLMREADGECFARGRVFVDTEEALAKAGDVLQAIAEGHFTPRALQGTLATCAGTRAQGGGKHLLPG